MVYSIQSAIFQGSRFLVASSVAVIVLYTPYLLQHAHGLPRRVERLIHTICLTIAVGIAVFVGLYLRHSGATLTDSENVRVMLNFLTYLWIGLVCIVALLFALLQWRVHTLRQSWIVRHDPDFEPRSAYEIRAKLVDLQQQLLNNIVRPLNTFPLIFILTALGEVGLVVLRNFRYKHCDDYHNHVCLAFYILSNFLIDVSGLLMALTYFRDHEARRELSTSRIRRRLDRSRRGVRFAEYNFAAGPCFVSYRGLI